MLAAASILGGCATFSTDGGFGGVEKAVKAHLDKDVVWVRDDATRDAAATRVAALLSRPLGADDAVQIALLNNRELQAVLFELGIAEADLVQAGRLPNPGFSFGRLRRGDELEIERSLHFSLARMIALPLVGELEERRFARTQRQLAMDMLRLAADVRKAYYAAVAAEETARYMRQVRQAAEAAAELARRLARAGNWNKLQHAREQGFYADAAMNQARAEQAQRAGRERLARLLGLWGEQLNFTLPERLPDLPAAPRVLPDIEQTALRLRLDVQAAKFDAEQMAKNLGLTKTTRFINVLELGAVRNTSNEAPPQRGWEIAFELPLFDWGEAKIAKAEAIYMQSLHRAAQTAIEARSEVREAYGAYRTAFDIARHHRDELLPIRKRIAEENLLRYNGMLIGVFELLADARSQIASVNATIESLRDFWIAQADLDMALTGRPALTALTRPGAAVPGAAGH